MKLTYKGVDETRKLFFDATRLHGPAVRQAAQVIAEDLARGLRKYSPTWRGTMKNSVTATSTMKGDTAVGTAKIGVDHAAPVDEGTGIQGPVGRRYFPDFGSPDLIGWAEAKGFDNAFHAAYIIWLYGTKPQKIVERTTLTFLDKAVKAGGDYYGKTVFKEK